MVYIIPRISIIPVIKLFTKKIEGLENLTSMKESGFIIASNHTSYMDHLFIASNVISKLDRKMHFLAKKEHFDNYLSRKWHEYAGAIPLDREAGGEDALRFAIKALKEKKIIGIYPEGTRSLTGKIQRGKIGVARLALASKVPVLPIGLIGTFEILPKGKHIPKFRKATIAIGVPMYFDKYYNKAEDPKVLRLITTKIMKEIGKLSNQKYEYE